MMAMADDAQKGHRRTNKWMLRSVAEVLLFFSTVIVIIAVAATHQRVPTASNKALWLCCWLEPARSDSEKKHERAELIGI